MSIFLEKGLNHSCKSGNQKMIYFVFTSKHLCVLYRYSQHSLSWPRLSWITAYLKVIIWSLFWYGNLTTGNKTLLPVVRFWLLKLEISWKYCLFHNIFKISLISGVKLHIHLLKVFVWLLVFLNSATLICWGMGISKCFRESRGLWDNESWL